MMKSVRMQKCDPNSELLPALLSIVYSNSYLYYLPLEEMGKDCSKTNNSIESISDQLLNACLIQH